MNGKTKHYLKIYGAATLVMAVFWAVILGLIYLITLGRYELKEFFLVFIMGTSISGAILGSIAPTGLPYRDEEN